MSLAQLKPRTLQVSKSDIHFMYLIAMCEELIRFSQSIHVISGIMKNLQINQNNIRSRLLMF